MANTFDADLVVDVLRDSAITILRNRLAPLNAFSQDFSTDELAPLKTVQVPIATAGSTTQTNATNFESGDSTLDNVAVSVSQYTNSFHLTNAQINSGHRLERIAKINAQQLADKIIDIALAPVTVANFGAAVVDVNTAADVGTAQLKTLWGALKDGDVRNCIVDGSIYAQFLPTYGESYQLAPGGGNRGMYGFDLFTYNNRWSAAGATISGFVCSPQAIAIASGLPASSPADSDMISQTPITIEGLGITVQANMWVSRSSRALWCSYDVMFGAAKGDGSALKVLVLTPP